MATATPDFPISHGSGQARPVWDHHLAPAIFDDALGATEARKEWEAANAAGLAAYRAWRSKQAAWMDANKESDFSDRADWLHAMNMHLRDEAAAEAACERRAVAALKKYRDAQQSSGANLVAIACDAAREADERARKAVADLEQALKDRATFVAHAGGRLQLRNISPQLPLGVKDLVDPRVLYTPTAPEPTSPRGLKTRGSHGF